MRDNSVEVVMIVWIGMERASVVGGEREPRYDGRPRDDIVSPFGRHGGGCPGGREVLASFVSLGLPLLPFP
jgi:hypothetical protein